MPSGFSASAGAFPPPDIAAWYSSAVMSANSLRSSFLGGLSEPASLAALAAFTLATVSSS